MTNQNPLPEVEATPPRVRRQQLEDRSALAGSGTRVRRGAGAASSARGDERAIRIAVLVGVVGSVVTLPLHALISHNASVQLSAVIVAVIGALYVGFAVQAGELRATIGECVVATVFVAAALIGMWIWAWAIPLAYAVHGIWDIAHHRRHLPALMVRPQRWYPPFCATFDWIFAIGLAVIWIV